MSVLVLSVVLTSGMVLMMLFTRDLKASFDTSQSIKAFYAADSGMEGQLYNIITNTNVQPASGNLNQETSFTCSTTTTQIQCIGMVGTSGRAVKRGIEVNF
ncbi:MAG: hypothetical protein KBI07_04920 [Candidatus Atribacteria bacterium]|nr:hypothetical protein [Candidatus Atribacteria bacterium]